jgi:hypothetical protein
MIGSYGKEDNCRGGMTRGGGRRDNILREATGKCFVHMGTSALITFGFLKKFKTLHFCIFKNYVVKYIDRFRHEECT